MELREFVAAVPRFAALSHPEKIKHFGWYLHVHDNRERFDFAAIRQCYVATHMEPPNFTREFGRLLDRGVVLKDSKGYRLEHKTRETLDKKYGEHETTIVISQLLKELPGKISDEAERLFLTDALKCYKVQAFRPAIVTTWNLAYDHVLNWLVKDAQRLSNFNSKIIGRVGVKRGTGLIMAKREDFEDLKESEVLDIAGNAGVFPSDNIKKILDGELTKRNIAAHPSLVEIDRPQADEAIYTLVSNVVLKLK
jgi:hypothetical protein